MLFQELECETIKTVFQVMIAELFFIRSVYLLLDLTVVSSSYQRGLIS